jgi:acyl carrier protein
MGGIVVDKARVLQSIYAVIDDLNQTRASSSALAKDPATALFGAQSVLDSLGLVNLIVGVEQRIADDLDLPITLADEKAMSQRNSPFRTVDTLADYILSIAKP